MVGKRRGKNSNMPGNSERLCMECVRVLDCASKAYFSRTSDIAAASSSLCNWLRHSRSPVTFLFRFPSLPPFLRGPHLLTMEDVFFGDACAHGQAKADEGEKKEIVCHGESRALYQVCLSRTHSTSTTDRGIYIMRARETPIQLNCGRIATEACT